MKLILFGLALVQLATEILAQRNGPMTVFYEELNYRRAQSAEEHQIANMNLMEYDESLEQMINDEVAKYDGCPPRVTIHIGNIQVFLNQTPDQTMMDQLLLTPGRTRVASYGNPCNEKVFFSFAADVSPYPIIHGAPGSKCPDGHKIEFLNLCVKPSQLTTYARKIGRKMNKMNDANRWDASFFDVPTKTNPSSKKYFLDDLMTQIRNIGMEVLTTTGKLIPVEVQFPDFLNEAAEFALKNPETLMEIDLVARGGVGTIRTAGLVDLLMKSGMSYEAVQEVAKRVMVTVAEKREASEMAEEVLDDLKKMNKEIWDDIILSSKTKFKK